MTYSAPQDAPAAQQFLYSLRLSKSRHPQKIAGYGTVQKNVLMFTFMNKCFLKSLWQMETQVNFFEK